MNIENILTKILFTKKFEIKIKKIYEKLDKEKKINLIHKLKKDLSLVRYNNKINFINDKFGKNNIDIGLSINQYIYSKLINKILFNAYLMIALSENKKFFYPLPKIYLDEIAKLVKVNYFLSNFLFFFFLFIMVTANILKTLLGFFYYFKFKKENSDLIYSNSHPQVEISSDGRFKKDNFYYFILKTFEIKNNIIFLHKNKNLKNLKIKNLNNFLECNYTIDPIKPFLNIFNFYNFFKSALSTLKFFFKSIVSRKYEMLILFHEVFNYYQYVDLNKKYKLCLFNQSEATYRPLWTYGNNKNNVFLYFYSINMIPPFQGIEDQKYYETRGFNLQSWDNYLTWNKKHEEFLNQNTKQDKKYLRVDYVPFDGKQKIFNKQKKIITVFDIPPKREFIYNLLSNPYAIHKLEYCLNFIKTIIHTLEKFDSKDFELIIKIKRINYYTDTKYIDYLEKISLKNNIKIIKEISAESIIDSSDIVISSPFTSTSTIAYIKGKKTIFYDPSGKIESSKQSLSENIQIINNKENLNSWLNKNL